jgi:hypothetical protein
MNKTLKKLKLIPGKKKSSEMITWGIIGWTVLLIMIVLSVLTGEVY